MRISNGIQNRNRRMPNGTYGGVRGRKTKVGEKLLRFSPTRLQRIILLKEPISQIFFVILSPNSESPEFSMMEIL